MRQMELFTVADKFPIIWAVLKLQCAKMQPNVHLPSLQLNLNLFKFIEENIRS